jgi:carboxylate-amine ligase
MTIEHFHGSAGPSLGVELEFQLVDATSMALTGAADRVIGEADASALDLIKPEFYSCCVEVNTGICQDVDEVGRDLAAKLSTAGKVARHQGVLLAWGGTHPFSHWRDQPVVPTPRYLELAEHFRETLCRQLTFGLHVHVGVRDGDTAVRVCRQLTERLPDLLALSANSPFWCGRATGLHSHRVEVMGASPFGGLPPRLGGWEDYARLVDHLMTVGVIRSPKDLWWDVRPSPEHGTVEIRMCDMPADLPSVLGLTALIQCLVADLAGGRDNAPSLDDCGMLIVRQNRWRAARFGLDAEFVEPRAGGRVPAREAIKDLVDRLRGVAERLGCERQLELAWAMADGPGGSERQLSVFERTGDLAEVTRHMVGGSGQETSPATHALSGHPEFAGAGTTSWPAAAPSQSAR